MMGLACVESRVMTIVEPLFSPLSPRRSHRCPNLCPDLANLSCTLANYFLFSCDLGVLWLHLRLQEEAAGEGGDEVDQAKLEKHSCT